MKGNSIEEFIDDLEIMGGPEKEFIHKNKFYFLETIQKTQNIIELRIEEFDNSNPKDKIYIQTYCYTGTNFQECVNKFKKATIFNDKTIYQVEPEIEVLFG